MSIATTMSPSDAVDQAARPLSRLSLRSVAAAASSAVRRISSQSLLEGGRELVIQHQGSEYHLRLTRNDKLILTK